MNHLTKVLLIPLYYNSKISSTMFGKIISNCCTIGLIYTLPQCYNIVYIQRKGVLWQMHMPTSSPKCLEVWWIVCASQTFDCSYLLHDRLCLITICVYSPVTVCYCWLLNWSYIHKNSVSESYWFYIEIKKVFFSF